MTATRWLGFVGALALLAGCGSVGSKEAALSTAKVRHAVAAQGLSPESVLDSRTATHADVDRLFPLPADAGRRQSILAARRAVYDLMDLGPEHPVAWLSYASFDLYVFGSVSDAEAMENAATPGDGVTRFANVAVVPVLGVKPPPRVAAALRELSKTK